MRFRIWSGPEGSFPHSSRLNHEGADEPNDGKAVMGCEGILGLEMVDRDEIQVLTGMNRLHGYTLGIQEGSVDDGTKGYHSH